VSSLEREAAANGISRYTPLGTFPEMINALNTKVVDGYVAEEPGAIADCSKNANLRLRHCAVYSHQKTNQKSDHRTN